MLLLAVVSAGVPGFSAAEDRKDIESVIVTADRSVRDRMELAHSVSRIGEAELELIGHVHISEALSRIPGTWISRGNGQEHLTAIRSAVLTGPGSCGAFFIAEDGVPVRAPGFCNVNQLFDLNTEQAAAIEVLRGPGTGVHGSNALNGVINKVSAAPEADLRRISIEGGPNDYGRIKLTVSDQDENSGYRININAAHDGGYKDDSGFDQQKMDVRYDREGEQWRSKLLVSASNLNQETAGFVQGFEAYKDSSLKDSNPNPEAYRDSQSLRIQWQFQRDAANDAQLTLTPYARHADMTFLQHFLPGTPLEENQQTSVGLQSMFRRPFNGNTYLFHGFDFDLTRGELVQTQSGPGFGPFYDYEVDAANVAWFIGAEHLSEDGTRWQGDVRYEHQRYDYDNRMSDGALDASGNPCASNPCRYSRPADTKDRFDNVSVSLGMVHPFNDEYSMVMRAAHGFRAPQATELYRLQAGQVSAKLDSESLNSLEFGLRGQLERLQFEWVAYVMRKRNLILQDANRIAYADGETRQRGMELAMDYRFSPSWSLGVQASVAKHRYASEFANRSNIDVKGNIIDTAPRRMASAQLQWTPNAESLIELALEYLGPYWLDAANTAQYQGHSLLHLRWQQQLTPALQFTLRGTNITDKDYAERADFAFGNYRYFVGEPASVYAEIELEY